MNSGMIEDSVSNALQIPIGSEFDGFEVFIVGGAVRDSIRGIEPSDFDLMAVPNGVSNPADVLSDRMVSIDPESTIPIFSDSHGREVALPRTEQKVDDGHRGFNMSIVDPGKSVSESVKIDLERRDLTVNSLAFNVRGGELFDPFDGVEDIKNGVIRHVSEAFEEDPLRVVRMARFAPRLESDIAPETESLARKMVDEEKLSHLPVERVTNEFRKVAKQSNSPGEFFRILDRVDAIEDTFPVVDEFDSVDVVSKAVDSVAPMNNDNVFISMLVAVGDSLPDGAVEKFNGSQAFSNDEQLAVRFGAAHGDRISQFDELQPEDVIDVFDKVGGNRGPQFPDIVRGLSGVRDVDVESIINRAESVENVFNAIGGEFVMDAENVRPEIDVSGEEFGELIRQHRIDAIK